MTLRRPLVRVGGRVRQLPDGDELPGAASWTITSTATSKALSAGEWVTVTAAGQTITLPASPAAGMECRVSVGAFDDTLVDFGGVDPWRINKAGATVTFAYNGSAWRYF